MQSQGIFKEEGRSLLLIHILKSILLALVQKEIKQNSTNKVYSQEITSDSNKISSFSSIFHIFSGVSQRKSQLFRNLNSQNYFCPFRDCWRLFTQLLLLYHYLLGVFVINICPVLSARLARFPNTQHRS